MLWGILFLTASRSFLFSQEKPPLVLSFTGDLMAHSINYRMADYSLIYKNLDGLLLEDDLTFGNVEFPMDPAKPMADFPSFNIHPGYVRAFIDAGLDVMALANNHTADSGMASVYATRKAAEDLQRSAGGAVYFSGIRDPEVPWNYPPGRFPVTAWEHRGWKIGFLSVTQFSNRPAEDYCLFQLNYNRPADVEAFLSWIEEIRPEYDLFVVSYHGGVEYAFAPQEAKVHLFRRMVEAGVDIVWGHHPHVLQPIEIVEYPGGRGAILYSLGNFLSGQGRIIDESLPEEEWSYTGDSAIIRIILDPPAGEPAGGSTPAVSPEAVSSEAVSPEADSPGAVRPRVAALVPIPTANYITPNRDVLIYPLEKLVLAPLPPPWDGFYRERKRIAADYFDKNIHTIRLDGAGGGSSGNGTGRNEAAGSTGTQPGF